MPRSRELSFPHPAPARARLTGGNGATKPDPGPLVRLEQLIEDIQHTLDIQFRRMAEMQADIDVLRANRRDG